MNQVKPTHPTTGFSLIEVVITLGLGALIMTASLWIFSSIARNRSLVSNNSQLVRASQIIFTQVSKDIHESNQVDLDFEYAHLYLNNQETVEYSLDTDNHRLLRNGEPITPDHIKVIGFNLIRRSPPNSLPLLEVELELASSDHRQVNAQLETSTLVSMRLNRGVSNLSD